MIKVHNPEEAPPHLIVRFKLVKGEENFEWGVTKGLPMMGLLGALCRVQHGLSLKRYPAREFVEGSLVIHYINGEFIDCCDSAIPVDPLIGMIEVIKGVINANITKSVEAHRNMQRVVLDRNGLPFKG